MTTPGFTTPGFTTPGFTTPGFSTPGFLKFRAALIAAPRIITTLGVASLLVTLLLMSAALPLRAQAIEFRPALELALKHSGVMLAASSDRVKAAANYRVQHSAYIPTVVFGSGIGYAFGQPVVASGGVGAPALFTVGHDQTLLNFSLRESIKAARSDARAADINYLDRGEQVILDTSLVYIELDNSLQRLASAQKQKEAVDHALYIAQQRLQEGVGSVLDSKRAELDSAKVDFRIAELETSIDVLRERLGNAIGRSAANMATVSASIPTTPALRAEDDIASVALANSASVRIADEHVRGARDRAHAEHKVNYPSIDFAGQFAQYAPFINYAKYYPSFTSEAYSFGVSVRIPIFNLAQNARAAAADADALHAEADAQIARENVAAEAVKTQHTIRQLEASAKVTRLEYEVAQANIDAVQFQVEKGQASSQDQELARADVANRQVALLQSQFEYIKAQLQLLRQTGELHAWALGKP
jgi:outer membrane protein TolC